MHLPLEEQINITINDSCPSFKLLPGVVIIHNIQTRRIIYISPLGATLLGVTTKDLEQMDMDQYHAEFFNQDEAMEYVPKIMQLLKRNNNEEIVSYFQQVRTYNSDTWTWFASSTKIFMRDYSHHPLLTITFALPIDSNHILTAKIDRLLEENKLLRNSKETFASLTKRELEILKLMATGNNSAEISAQLFISEETTKTHKRNIKSKLKIQTNYEIVRFAQAFDLV